MLNEKTYSYCQQEYFLFLLATWDSFFPKETDILKFSTSIPQKTQKMPLNLYSFNFLFCCCC